MLSYLRPNNPAVKKPLRPPQTHSVWLTKDVSLTSQYQLSSALAIFLKTTQTLTGSQILQKVAFYIEKNSLELFDYRNKAIVLCEHDALGALLKVEAFELCQLGTFLKPHVNLI